MAETKVYKTEFSMTLGEGPSEFRIPLDVNGNEHNDEIVVNLLSTSLFVDGEYAGAIGVDNPFDHPVVQIHQIDVGEFDGKPGLDAKFHSYRFESPLLMSHDQLLDKWQMQQKFREDRKDFQGLKTALAQPYSETTVKKVLQWLSCYEGRELMQALELARPVLEPALSDVALDPELKWNAVEAFSTSAPNRGYSIAEIRDKFKNQADHWPEWSFEPIYKIYTDPNLQGSEGTRQNTRSACAWAMGGAKTDEQIERIYQLLVDPNLPWADKKGFLSALANSGHPRATELILKYAKGPIGDNEYSMMIIPYLLLVYFNDRQAYWDLQTYYADILTQNKEDPRFGGFLFTYLGYDLTSLREVGDYTQKDLDSINLILQKLEERKSRFGEERALVEEIQDWRKMKSYVEGE